MKDVRLNLALFIFGLISLIVAAALGSTSLSIGQVLGGLIGFGPTADQIIIWEIRLPRALAAWLAGAALGASGAALQGLLRNPLAEPGVLGISAISTLFATLVLYYGLAGVVAAAVPLAAIAGAVLATSFLLISARNVGSIVTLILIGIGLTSFAGALMALLLNLAPNPFTLSDMINWTLGSVANRGFNDIFLCGPFILVGFLFLIAARRSLSALTLGEEVAHSMGVNLKHSRRHVIVGAGLATGGAVALAGTIGFVGIVAPHLVRPYVDHDPARTVLPASLLSGSVVVLADIGVRLIPTSSELKLGVIAALLGAPVFIWIAARRGGSDGIH